MSVARDTPPDGEATVAMPLVSAGSSDRCAACGAHLAVDQRYCVECGTRRGAPRFELAGQSSGRAAAERTAPPPKPGLMARIMRPGASAVTLIGLFILLLALGIGVLIGHSGNVKPVKQGPINVVVNGGGSGSSGGTASDTGSSASTAGASSSGSSSSGSTGSTGSSTKSSSKKSTKSTTKSAAKAAVPSASNTAPAAKGKSATSAAAKSFSSSATSKSTLGGKCTAGTAGCSSSGQQTGNLFGG